MAMRYLATIALCFMAGSSALAAAPPPSAHLCRQDERIVFTCSVKRQILSVCASSTLDEHRGEVQYRFGDRKRTELVFPASPAVPRDHFHLSSAMYSGGGEDRLRFTNGGYDYLVFSRTTKGDWQADGVRPTDFDDGVLVRKNGKVVSVRRCDGSPTSLDREFLSRAISEEPFDYFDFPVPPGRR